MAFLDKSDPTGGRGRLHDLPQQVLANYATLPNVAQSPCNWGEIVIPWKF